MATQCTSDAFPLAGLGRRHVVAKFDGGRLSSDGGAVLLRAANQAFQVTGRLAACFIDHRNPARVEHSLGSLLGQRVFALALGYEDINDHDRLRDDSLLALALDEPDLTGQSRRRERDRGHALAGSSTLNRLELGTPLEADEDRYKKVVASTEQIDDLLVDLFLDMHETLPERIVLDVDATDDQLHGQQEGRFYHGYYRHYCYLPLYITCGEHVLCARLRTAQAEAAEGTVAELERIVRRIRQRWPQAAIVVRGDRRFLPGHAHELVRAAGSGLCVGPGAEQSFAGPDSQAAAASGQGLRADRPGGAAFPGFPLPHAEELGPAAESGGQGGVAARPARREPALRGHQLEPGGSSGQAAVRGTVLRPRRDGEPDQGATAGSVRGPHIDGDDAGEPAADVLFGVRRHAAADHAPLRAGGQSAGAGPKRHDPEQDPEGGRGGEGDGAQGMAAFLLDVPAQGTLREHREAADGSEAKGLPGMSVADGRTGARWRAEGRGQAEVRPDCAPGGQQACQEGHSSLDLGLAASWNRFGYSGWRQISGISSTCAQSATVAAQDGHRAQLW